MQWDRFYYIQAVMHGIDVISDIPVSVRHEIQELLENRVSSLTS